MGGHGQLEPLMYYPPKVPALIAFCKYYKKKKILLKPGKIEDASAFFLYFYGDSSRVGRNVSFKSYKAKYNGQKDRMGSS